MKPLFTAAAIITLLLFNSCTKKYTCKCTTTLSQDGYYPHKTETLEDIKKNSSKKRATQICSNTAKKIQANTSLIWPDYVNVTTNCVLRDY